VLRYCGYYDLPIYRDRSPEYPDGASRHNISQPLNSIGRAGSEHFTVGVLKNRQRTSQVNGILKAEVVYKWAKVLWKNGIEVLQDVSKIDKRIENELCDIKGQRSCISLSYF